MNIGDKIRQRRIELDMTQDELAKKCGYKSRSSIQKIECSRDLPLKKVQEFAKYLDLPVSYLMGWEEGSIKYVPDFEPDHIELIEMYSKLTKEQKQTVMSMLHSFTDHM